MTRTAVLSDAQWERFTRNVGVKLSTAGHGIGRSRDGLTTKVHHAVDGKGRPLAAVVTAERCHDGKQLQAVTANIWVPASFGFAAEPQPSVELDFPAFKFWF